MPSSFTRTCSLLQLGGNHLPRAEARCRSKFPASIGPIPAAAATEDTPQGPDDRLTRWGSVALLLQAHHSPPPAGAEGRSPAVRAPNHPVGTSRYTRSNSSAFKSTMTPAYSYLLPAAKDPIRIICYVSLLIRGGSAPVSLTMTTCWCPPQSPLPAGSGHSPRQVGNFSGIFRQVLGFCGNATGNCPPFTRQGFRHIRGGFQPEDHIAAGLLSAVADRFRGSPRAADQPHLPGARSIMGADPQADGHQFTPWAVPALWAR